MTDMRISYELPGLPKSPNGSHGHWRSSAAERKRWRTWSCISAMSEMNRQRLVLTTPWPAVRLTCTRFSTRRMDFDNLAASFKGAVDGLKDAGLISDDADTVILERSYRWERAGRCEGRVRIEVEALVQNQTSGALSGGRLNDAQKIDPHPQSAERNATAGNLDNPDLNTQPLCKKYTVPR